MTANQSLGGWFEANHKQRTEGKPEDKGEGSGKTVKARISPRDLSLRRLPWWSHPVSNKLSGISDQIWHPPTASGFSVHSPAIAYSHEGILQSATKETGRLSNRLISTISKELKASGWATFKLQFWFLFYITHHVYQSDCVCFPEPWVGCLWAACASGRGPDNPTWKLISKDAARASTVFVAWSSRGTFTSVASENCSSATEDTFFL